MLNQTGPLNYRTGSNNQNKSDIVGKTNFSHAASKFIDRRKKMSSQQNKANRSFQDASRYEHTNNSPDEENSQIKDADTIRHNFGNESF